MSGFEIREALPSDRDAILSFDHVFQADPGRASFIDRALRTATCLVADRNGRAVAYGVLEYTFFGNGFVSMVYVAEAHRRRGMGRALLVALADRCTTEKLFTSTNRSNESMQSLLGTLGYVPSGSIENLDPGDPELVYFLDLRGCASIGVAEPTLPT